MKRFRIAALCLILIASMSTAFAQQREHHEATLSEQVDELRMAGRYDEALARARDHLALVESLPTSKAHEIADARRQVLTLETIVELPDEARREIVDTLVDRVRGFSVLESLPDDVTVVVVRVEGSEAPRS
jgi:ribosomal protein L17